MQTTDCHTVAANEGEGERVGKGVVPLCLLDRSMVFDVVELIRFLTIFGSEGRRRELWRVGCEFRVTFTPQTNVQTRWSGESCANTFDLCVFIRSADCVLSHSTDRLYRVC